MSNLPEHTGDESDFLRGATEIVAFLRSIGFGDVDEDQVYYWHRSGKLQFGKFGKHLFSSKRALRRDLQRLAKASVATT